MSWPDLGVAGVWLSKPHMPAKFVLAFPASQRGAPGVASGCTAGWSDGSPLLIALGRAVPLLGIYGACCAQVVGRQIRVVELSCRIVSGASGLCPTWSRQKHQEAALAKRVGNPYSDRGLELRCMVGRAFWAPVWAWRTRLTAAGSSGSVVRTAVQ